MQSRRDVWAVNVVFGQRPTEQNHQRIRDRATHDHKQIERLKTLKLILELGHSHFDQLGVHLPLFAGNGKRKVKRRNAIRHLLWHRTARTYALRTCSKHLTFYEA